MSCMPDSFGGWTDSQNPSWMDGARRNKAYTGPRWAWLPHPVMCNLLDCFDDDLGPRPMVGLVRVLGPPGTAENGTAGLSTIRPAASKHPWEMYYIPTSVLETHYLADIDPRTRLCGAGFAPAKEE